MKKLSLLIGACLLAFGTQANADQANIHVQGPAKDGAYVLKLKGMVNNMKIVTLGGGRQTVNDALVIRGSYVKDGKVVIPANGLYTTSRCENWWSLNDQTFTMNGKVYHLIADEFDLDVVKNVTMKPGDMVYSDPSRTRGWTMSKIRPDGFGINGAYSATFTFLKATGNPYGTPFYVMAGSSIKNYVEDGKHAKGSGFKKGATSSMTLTDTKTHIEGIKHVSVGRSSVTIDSLTADEAKVKELVVPRTTMALISPDEPVVGTYGKGEKIKVGNAVIEVVDVKAGKATVKITDAKGSVTKTFSATKDELDQLPVNRVVVKKLCALSKSGSEAVHANIHSKDGIIKDGKVALVAYGNVLKITPDTPWATDSRFTVRPETCASCTFIHEIMVENPKDIVLDAKNNVYEGPDGYFKIVLDEIEGDTVKAWHIETAKEKSENLAGRSKGKHIDAVVGASCRSGGAFFKGLYADLYKEAIAK